MCFGCLSFNTLYAFDELHLELSQHSDCSKPIYCSEVLRSAIRLKFIENASEWADALLETKTLGWKPPISVVEDFDITAQVEIYKTFLARKNINFDEQKKRQIIEVYEVQKLKQFFERGALHAVVADRSLWADLEAKFESCTKETNSVYSGDVCRVPITSEDLSISAPGHRKRKLSVIASASIIRFKASLNESQFSSLCGMPDCVTPSHLVLPREEDIVFRSLSKFFTRVIVNRDGCLVPKQEMDITKPTIQTGIGKKTSFLRLLKVMAGGDWSNPHAQVVLVQDCKNEECLNPNHQRIYDPSRTSSEAVELLLQNVYLSVEDSMQKTKDGCLLLLDKGKQLVDDKFSTKRWSHIDPHSEDYSYRRHFLVWTAITFKSYGWCILSYQPRLGEISIAQRRKAECSVNRECVEPLHRADWYQNYLSRLQRQQKSESFSREPIHGYFSKLESRIIKVEKHHF